MDDLHRKLARALTNVRKVNRNNARAYLKEMRAKQDNISKLASVLGWSGINTEADFDLLLQHVLQQRADLGLAKITISRLTRQLEQNNTPYFVEDF